MIFINWEVKSWCLISCEAFRLILLRCFDGISCWLRVETTEERERVCVCERERERGAGIHNMTQVVRHGGSHPLSLCTHTHTHTHTQIEPQTNKQPHHMSLSIVVGTDLLNI